MIAALLVCALALGVPGVALAAEQVVVSGTVMSAQASFETTESGDRLIVTHARVAVTETHAGESLASIDVEIEGGTVDGLTLAVSDMPVVRPGQQYLLSLEQDGRGKWVPKGRRDGIRLLSEAPQVEPDYVAYGPKWPTPRVTYYVNPVNADSLEEGAVLADVQQAASAWSVQTQANIQLVFGGRTTATVVQADRVNNVFFLPEASGSTIAVCYYWYDGMNNLIDFDIKYFDSGFRFWLSTQACGGGQYILDVGTHEFGHGLGLGHSADGTATMYPSTGNCSQNWRTLSADDILGIETIYPFVTEPTEPPAAPTSLTLAVKANKKFATITLSWRDNADNEDAYLVERTSDPACFTGFSQVASLAPNVTTYANSKLGFGQSYCYRVRASNSYGFSFYSNAVAETTPSRR